MFISYNHLVYSTPAFIFRKDIPHTRRASVYKGCYAFGIHSRIIKKLNEETSCVSNFHFFAFRQDTVTSYLSNVTYH